MSTKRYARDFAITADAIESSHGEALRLAAHRAIDDLFDAIPSRVDVTPESLRLTVDRAPFGFTLRAQIDTERHESPVAIIATAIADQHRQENRRS